MIPKTKKDQLLAIRDGILAGLEQLEKQIDELPDEARPVTEGWDFWEYGALSLTRLTRNGDYAVHVCEVLKSGLKINNKAHDALDGIDHDSKGRIKVVGYVNAEDLKGEFPVDTDVRFSSAVIHEVIDGLAG